MTDGDPNASSRAGATSSYRRPNSSNLPFYAPDFKPRRMRRLSPQFIAEWLNRDQTPIPDLHKPVQWPSQWLGKFDPVIGNAIAPFGRGYCVDVGTTWEPIRYGRVIEEIQGYKEKEKTVEEASTDASDEISDESTSTSDSEPLDHRHHRDPGLIPAREPSHHGGLPIFLCPHCKLKIQGRLAFDKHQELCVKRLFEWMSDAFSHRKRENPGLHFKRRALLSTARSPRPQIKLMHSTMDRRKAETEAISHDVPNRINAAILCHECKSVVERCDEIPGQRREGIHYHCTSENGCEIAAKGLQLIYNRDPPRNMADRWSSNPTYLTTLWKDGCIRWKRNENDDPVYIKGENPIGSEEKRSSTDTRGVVNINNIKGEMPPFDRVMVSMTPAEQDVEMTDHEPATLSLVPPSLSIKDEPAALVLPLLPIQEGLSSTVLNQEYDHTYTRLDQQQRFTSRKQESLHRDNATWSWDPRSPVVDRLVNR